MKRKTAAGIATFVAMLLAAPIAVAAEVPVNGGDADWGVRQSFRTYVTGPANGTITTSEGATRNADGTFDFTPASGSLDTAGGTGRITFGGSVFFQGSPGGMPNALELRITNPRLQFAGATGTLYADVTSKEGSGPSAGQTIAYPNVDLATANLTGIAPTVTATSASYAGIPLNLTANGSQAFAGFYQPGAVLDPISFSVALADEAARIKAAGKKQRVTKRDRSVVLGRAKCLVETCKVTVPKNLTATIRGGENKGDKVRVKVLGPKNVKLGQTATYRAKFPGGAVKKLAEGGNVKLRAKLQLANGGLRETQNLKVTVRG